MYHLAVVATNRETFETGLLNLTVNVTAANLATTAKFNIKLKIDNLNIWTHPGVYIHLRDSNPILIQEER